MFFFATPHGMWDLSSLTRDCDHTTSIRRQSLNHWTTREIPNGSLQMNKLHGMDLYLNKLINNI